MHTKLKNKKRLIPFIIFLIIVVFLWRGLGMNPRILPSALLNKRVPEFSLPLLKSPQHKMTEKIFQGHVSLLNVWATWCAVCQAEHPMLMAIAAQHIVPIYGLDYKDKRSLALKRLQQLGNPYQKIAFDKYGATAINFGVYGTPETYIIDKHGFIRFKQIGMITQSIWTKKMLPVIKKLQLTS